MLNLDEQQAKTLGQIFGAINRSEDLLPLLDKLLVQVVELAGQRAGWILIQDDGKEDTKADHHFFLAAHYNLPPAIDIENVDMWPGSCECQGLYTNNQLAEVNEQTPGCRYAGANMIQPGFGNHVCFPLCSGGRFLGTLNVVTNNGAPLSPVTLNLLSAVAAHLGTALDRQRLADLTREKLDEEQATLLALTSQLLRTAKLDDVLEHLVKEVIRLFQVDACALLLPDEQGDYLVFRASAGWQSDPVAQQRRIPGNDQSGSGRVMRDQVPILSKNNSDRSAMPELTIEWLDDEKFEGIVIVPLVVDEQSIGALAATSRTPREFDEDEIRFLQILANQAAIAIKNTRLQKEEIQLKRLEDELAVGRRIQRSLLPASSPAMDGWQFSDIYRPARQVGGDLYDYFKLPYGEKQLGLVIGDVADKGVPAALFMATSRTLIRSTALAGLTAASTLTEANRLILQDSQSELFLSAFYGILDTVSGRLSYASAGHNPPIWFRQATAENVALRAKGILLCVQDEVLLEERTIDIARGDILVLYTDGVTETMNMNYEEFGLQRLQQVVAANSQKSAAQILAAIVGAVDAFRADIEHTDDLTIVVAKRL